MPMTRFALALLGAGLLICPRSSLTAQASPGLPARFFSDRFFSDSTLWDRLLTHVVGSLDTYLVRTSADSNRQPWLLELPDNAPQPELLLRQLRTILRARPAAASDTLIFKLLVGHLTISNDTARIVIRTEFGKRCPQSDAIGGFGNYDSVVVPRLPRYGWAVARSVAVRHGDRGGCAGPW